MVYLFIVEKRTLKAVYQQFFEDLVRKLQVKDPIFNAKLLAVGLFPSNTGAEVVAKSTPAEAATHFLHSVIDRGWSNDNSNSELEKLLTIMENCDDDDVVKSLASDIRKGNVQRMCTCL